MLEFTPLPQFTVVVPPKLLQEGYLVSFTNAWPSTLSAVRGKTFQINRTNQVPHSLRFIIPTGDFRDVDLSNGSADAQESLYPVVNSNLYEVSLGLSPGAYVVHFLIPATRFIHELGFAGQSPNVNSATLVYLGARRPQDSPIEDPRIKFYLVNDLTPLILRVFTLPGVDFEKIIMELTINKLDLVEIENPTDDQLVKSKVIRYFEELRF